MLIVNACRQRQTGHWTNHRQKLGASRPPRPLHYIEVYQTRRHSCNSHMGRNIDSFLCGWKWSALSYARPNIKFRFKKISKRINKMRWWWRGLAKECEPRHFVMRREYPIPVGMIFFICHRLVWNRVSFIQYCDDSWQMNQILFWSSHRKKSDLLNF